MSTVVLVCCVLIAAVAPKCSSEMYTSLLNVKQAISVEQKLIDYLRIYIDHEQERLQDIKRQFLETSRYILFASMLINDMLQILSSVLLFLFIRSGKTGCGPPCPSAAHVHCHFPEHFLILATMSLELYVGIFYSVQRPAA